MYIHECYCVCAMVCAYALVCMWRQEDDFWKSFFSFYHRFWGSNSGHQICVASPLPTEPCCSLEKELGGKALRQRCFLTKGDLECGGSWLCTSDGVKLIWEPVAPVQERSQHCPCTWKIEYLGKWHSPQQPDNCVNRRIPSDNCQISGRNLGYLRKTNEQNGGPSTGVTGLCKLTEVPLWEMLILWRISQDTGVNIVVYF